MINFEMGKKIAAGGFFLGIVGIAFEFFAYFFSMHFFYGIANIFYYAGFAIPALGFLIMFLDGRNLLDFLTAAITGVLFLLSITNFSFGLSAFLSRCLFASFYIPMLLNAKRDGNAPIAFLLLLAFLYKMFGILIINALFFHALRWYSFGVFVSMAAGVVCDGICVLSCLNRKRN